MSDPISRNVTRVAIVGIREHLAGSGDKQFARMAGRAEEGIGEPETVSLAAALLAQDLLDALLS